MVYSNEGGGSGKAKPDNRALFKALPEAFPESGPDVGAFPPHHFQADIVQGADGRADGDEGNTGYQEDNIEDDQVGHVV